MRVQFFYSPLRALGEIQQDVERAFQHWWDWHSPLNRMRQGIWSPPTDVYETPTDVVVKLEMAGTIEDSIEILLYDDYIVISGERQDLADTPRIAFHQMDIWYGRFRAEVPLPAPVDSERVEACYENGMILVTLPKPSAEQAQPKQIRVSLPKSD